MWGHTHPRRPLGTRVADGHSRGAEGSRRRPSPRHRASSTQTFERRERGRWHHLPPRPDRPGGTLGARLIDEPRNHGPLRPGQEGAGGIRRKPTGDPGPLGAGCHSHPHGRQSLLIKAHPTPHRPFNPRESQCPTEQLRMLIGCGQLHVRLLSPAVPPVPDGWRPVNGCPHPLRALHRLDSALRTDSHPKLGVRRNEIQGPDTSRHRGGLHRVPSPRRVSDHLDLTIPTTNQTVSGRLGHRPRLPKRQAEEQRNRKHAPERRFTPPVPDGLASIGEQG